VHICGEEIAMFMATIPGFYLLSVKFKVWWHGRHAHKDATCPHNHKDC
jgi:hypothetical protein